TRGAMLADGVTFRTRRRSSAAQDRVTDRPQAKAHDEEHRLARDATGHLRGAERALAEDDRHLDDASPAAMRPPGRLDLEAVAGCGDLAQPDGVEQVRAPGLEAAGEVPIREEEHGAREERAAHADQAPMP